MSFNNVGHFITSTITILQHFATLNHTSPNYTSLHLSTLHFLSFTLHYSPIWLNPSTFPIVLFDAYLMVLYLTSVHPPTVGQLQLVKSPFSSKPFTVPFPVCLLCMWPTWMSFYTRARWNIYIREPHKVHELRCGYPWYILRYYPIISCNEPAKHKIPKTRHPPSPLPHHRPDTCTENAGRWIFTQRELKNSSLASQEIPRNLRNPKVHYRIHNSPPPVPFLSPHPTSWSTTLNIILPSMLGSSK